MIKVKSQGQILSAQSKPYDISGNKGVSHKVRVLAEGEIFNLKATEAQVLELQSSIGDNGEVEIGFSAPKENLAGTLLSFDA